MQNWNENVSNLRFVAWDTETTGVSPQADSIVEIAALAFDEDFEHRRFESLIKPRHPIPPDVVKIHGISDEVVANAAPAEKVLGEFHSFLNLSGSPRVLLAHNSGFDVGMVHGEFARMPALERSEVSSPEIVIDTCMLAKSLMPELVNHKLQGLAEHFKLADNPSHRALADVRALYGIFMNLLGLAADRLAAAQGLTLNHLVDLAGGYFVLDGRDAQVRKQPFRLPPRISALEALCGSDARVAIQYEIEQDYRYITPIEIRVRAFKVYVEAFCHRDSMKKTFRADKILKIGRVDSP